MDVMHFDPASLNASRITLPEASALSGIVWVDITPRDEGWAKQIEQYFGITIDYQHLKDTTNGCHPPFYDTHPQYEMLVFEALTDTTLKGGSFKVVSAPITFFIHNSLLISFHNSEHTNFNAIRERWLNGSFVRPPLSGLGFLCLLLSHLTDKYLGLRLPFSQQLESWQARLLEPAGRFRDWADLLNASNDLRHLRMSIVEPQEEALDALIDETDLELDPRIAARLSDVLEHFNRVSRFVESIQKDLENLVQIYFSATNQRTTDIMRVLTIASVIFLPLNLLAGIYGMNFEHIPGAQHYFGFYEVIAGMLGLTCFLVLMLYLKRWL